MTRSLTPHILVVPGVLCALLVGALVAHGEPLPQTVFSRLEEADARSHHAARHANALRERVDEHDAVILSTLEELDVTRRATEKLRQELVADHIDWERAMRRVRRHGHKQVGYSDRLERLLGYAAPGAMSARAGDHAIVGALDHGEAMIQRLVGTQSALIVRLAQERASENAAKAEHATTLSDARKAPASRVSKDLKITDEKLAAELSLLIKNPSTKDFHRYKGTLLPPVKGRPDHAFGPRKQRKSSSYVRHTGYTYLVEKGTEVRATASGLVTFAERFEGFGLLLIIDHGTGYHSLYAHLGDFEVKAGERIKKGDTLGRSGESGSLDGPKLYFELRKKGKPIDPADWFIRF